MNYQNTLILFEHVSSSSNLLVNYLSRYNFQNSQLTLSSKPELIYNIQLLPIIDNDREIKNQASAENFNKNNISQTV